MSKIYLNKLQKIINEEIKKIYLSEGEQVKSALSHAQDAAKCLDAIEKYKQAATSKALAELGESLTQVEKILNRITQSPIVYADATVPDKKDERTPLKSEPTSATQMKKKTVKPKVSSSKDPNLL